MSVEAMRGCGYRKVGGLYLCGSGFAMACDRIPYELELCPVCGSGIKFTRGWTWIDWLKYASEHEGCSEKLPTERIETTLGPAWKMPISSSCPVCWPDVFPQPYGLLWVGEANYTPQAFIQEALTMGVSRKIAGVPRNLKLGETWVLFAHKSACGKRRPPFATVVTPELEEEDIPGIFYAFRPQSLELLIWQSEAKPEYLEELTKRNITPIIIPDGDEDHDPDTKTKMTAEDRADVVLGHSIAALRTKIGR